jgi:ribosomal protein L4
MNEELIERLFIDTQKQITSKTTKDFANKFTELIILECEQISLTSSHREDDMGAIIARNIKKHFGVE